MFKSNSSQLYLLVRSLTKAEKRNFRLYAKRNFGEKDVKFLLLFDLLDKQETYDYDKIRAKFAKTSNSAFSNLRSHLHEQILISLRLLHRNDADIRMHDLLSFAKVLYSKGLYLQSLEQLNKARAFAKSLEDDSALHAVIELERKLELLYVTESGDSRAQEIVDMDLDIREHLNKRDDWANLSLLLYDYYLKFGHVKNERQFSKVQAFFNEKVDEIGELVPSLQGQVYQEMAYTWYYFITQNFSRCYRHAMKWNRLIESNELLLHRDPILYLKGVHQAMSALYYSNKPRQFERLFAHYKSFISKNESNFDQNTLILSNVYRYMAELNRLFLSGNFRDNEPLIEEITLWLTANERYIDVIRVQVIQYKIACLYFGVDDFKNCILYLNRIINSNVKERQLKQDVQCFSRILNLISHYELGHDDLVDSQLKSTYRFLIKYGDLQQVQQEIIKFIRKSVFMNRNELTEHFVELKSALLTIVDDPYERRPLLYLDLIAWLTSRIEGRLVEEVIHERQELR